VIRMPKPRPKLTRRLTRVTRRLDATPKVTRWPSGHSHPSENHMAYGSIIDAHKPTLDGERLIWGRHGTPGLAVAKRVR